MSCDRCGHGGVTVIVPGMSPAQADARFVRQEVGPWTPQDFSSGGPGINFVGTPTYVRMGRLVMLFAVITYNANVSPADAVIGNLPFPVALENSFGQYGPGRDVAPVGTLVPWLNVGFGGQIWFFIGSPAVRAVNADLSGITAIPIALSYLTDAP